MQTGTNILIFLTPTKQCGKLKTEYHSTTAFNIITQLLRLLHLQEHHNLAFRASKSTNDT